MSQQLLGSRMGRPSKALFAFGALACISSFGGPAVPTASAIVIDALVDPYPPSPCLVQSGARVFYAGVYCDGASCPPSSLANCVSFVWVQDGLQGVLGGTRLALLDQRETGNVSSYIDTTSHGWLDLHFEPSSLHAVEHRFGFRGPLNANFLVGGSGSILVPVLEVEPSGQTEVSIGLSSHMEGAETYWNVSRDVVAPGLLVFPYADFTGVDFSDIDFVEILIGAFHPTGPGHIRVGAITTDEQPTRGLGKTWGEIKAGYRE
jgi:hypothetical protein